jgi:hypothetical protein
VINGYLPKKSDPRYAEWYICSTDEIIMAQELNEERASVLTDNGAIVVMVPPRVWEKIRLLKQLITEKGG